ncbi:MAG: amidohydrolase [Oscillospiraceae bacterium]|nr:amidohydrolase [Oscillospiraceae bacterium]
MPFTNGVYSQYDLEAAKILNDFLPDRIFDSHLHLFDSSFAPGIAKGGGFNVSTRADFQDYLDFIKPLLGEHRQVRGNFITAPDATMTEPNSPNRKASVEFLVQQLDQFPGNVGEVMVGPKDTVEDIENLLIHPDIRGFKCYHVTAENKPTTQAAIGEYLPESAWQVANQRGMVITLHMVKDRSLADPENYEYILQMAKRYPNAKLILAHCARAFAAWTGVEMVDKIKHLDNVYYDFSAICESPAMFQILRKVGKDKCMWGSDFPVCRLSGKAISLADSFYWINANILEQLGNPNIPYWQYSTENLMAVRQACLMLDLSQDRVEDLFWNNAMKLFDLK